MSRLAGWPRAKPLPDDVNEAEVVEEIHRIAALPPDQMTRRLWLFSLELRNELSMIQSAHRPALSVAAPLADAPVTAVSPVSPEERAASDDDRSDGSDPRGCRQPQTTGD